MTVESLLTAARERADALGSADAARLRELLHPEFRWTSHRGETVDRETYIANNTSGSLRWIAQNLDDAQATVVDGTGVVRAIAVDHVVRDGVAEIFRMPMTQTWVHSDGRWQCLAGHAGPRIPAGHAGPRIPAGHAGPTS